MISKCKSVMRFNCFIKIRIIIRTRFVKLPLNFVYILIASINHIIEIFIWQQSHKMCWKHRFSIKLSCIEDKQVSRHEFLSGTWWRNLWRTLINTGCHPLLASEKSRISVLLSDFLSLLKNNSSQPYMNLTFN